VEEETVGNVLVDCVPKLDHEIVDLVLQILPPDQRSEECMKLLAHMHVPDTYQRISIHGAFDSLKSIDRYKFAVGGTRHFISAEARKGSCPDGAGGELQESFSGKVHEHLLLVIAPWTNTKKRAITPALQELSSQCHLRLGGSYGGMRGYKPCTSGRMSRTIGQCRSANVDRLGAERVDEFPFQALAGWPKLASRASARGDERELVLEIMRERLLEP
jgi:hypothetical protein